MRLRRPALAVAFLTSALIAAAQDVKLHVTYVCSGEHIYVENCNIRDTSDTSTCMVAHPDHLTKTGMVSYTYLTRGALKTLLPTCRQPTAQELAAEQAFQKKQQALIDAQTPQSNSAPPASASAPAPSAAGSYGALPPPKDPQERAMRRCVSSGRDPTTCSGNGLMSAFTGMISSTLSSLTGAPDPNSSNAPPDAGPNMAGVFQGAGNWRLDFITDGVLVNCSFLSPNQEAYSMSIASNRATLTIHTAPKPLVLSVNMDGAITGPPGPVTIDGVVPGGSVGGGISPGHTETTQTTTYYQNRNDGTVDSHTTSQSTYVPGAYTAPQTTFAPRRATCPAINLTSRGAGVGVETMETNVLKTAFGGTAGPQTPPGIRMHGIFAAASTGFSVQFFPESAILGCGPDAARAYPYTVVADGAKAVVNVAVPDHPLTLAFRAGGSLDPGSGPYQVHGRLITGQDDNDNLTFAPMERTCNLALLAPAREIPSAGGAAAASVASAGVSTPDKPLGNATLAIVSGLGAAPNPLAGRPFVLLRDSYAGALAKAGVSVPAGVSPYVFVGQICAPQPRTAVCQSALTALNSNAASAVRADAGGNGTLPGVPPGTYYLLISAPLNGQPMVWGQAVTLNAGANSITLTAANAQPMK